jgi:hypothetical protein
MAEFVVIRRRVLRREHRSSTPRMAASAVLLLVLAAGTASCKGSVQERFAKVRSACRAGQLDEAKRLTEDLRKSDERFDRLYKESVSDLGKHTTNYCDPLLLLEIEKEINKPEVKGPG